MNLLFRKKAESKLKKSRHSQEVIWTEPISSVNILHCLEGKIIHSSFLREDILILRNEGLCD